MQSLCNFNLAETHNGADASISFSPQAIQHKSSVSISIESLNFLSTVPPMVWIQNQLVGSAVGQRITLECQSEAYPKSINYWMKNDTIITQGKSMM